MALERNCEFDDFCKDDENFIQSAVSLNALAICCIITSSINALMVFQTADVTIKQTLATKEMGIIVRHILFVLVIA